VITADNSSNFETQEMRDTRYKIQNTRYKIQMIAVHPQIIKCQVFYMSYRWCLKMFLELCICDFVDFVDYDISLISWEMKKMTADALRYNS